MSRPRAPGTNRESWSLRDPSVRPVSVMLVAIMLGLVSGCGQSSTPATTIESTSTSLATTTTTRAETEVVVLPEFIQGVIPGARLVLLVGQPDPGAGPLTIIADAPEAAVTVQPSTISGTEIAEVTIVPDATTVETELDITINTHQDDTTHTIARTVTVVPWEDDRAEQATQILGLFTAWLAENHRELGVTPETQFTGTFLAPQLLVVSHYGFFNDEWELGLSWHVMIPPDDFAEVYLRPRSELRPTLAFRIGSWQIALETGNSEIIETDPPLDVIR